MRDAWMAAHRMAQPLPLTQLTRDEPDVSPTIRHVSIGDPFTTAIAMEQAGDADVGGAAVTLAEEGTQRTREQSVEEGELIPGQPLQAMPTAFNGSAPMDQVDAGHAQRSCTPEVSRPQQAEQGAAGRDAQQASGAPLTEVPSAAEAEARLTSQLATLGESGQTQQLQLQDVALVQQHTQLAYSQQRQLKEQKKQEQLQRLKKSLGIAFAAPAQPALPPPKPLPLSSSAGGQPSQAQPLAVEAVGHALAAISAAPSGTPVSAAGQAQQVAPAPSASAAQQSTAVGSLSAAQAGGTSPTSAVQLPPPNTFPQVSPAVAVAPSSSPKLAGTEPGQSLVAAVQETPTQPAASHAHPVDHGSVAVSRDAGTTAAAKAPPADAAPPQQAAQSAPDSVSTTAQEFLDSLPWLAASRPAVTAPQGPAVVSGMADGPQPEVPVRQSEQPATVQRVEGATQAGPIGKQETQHPAQVQGTAAPNGSSPLEASSGAAAAVPELVSEATPSADKKVRAADASPLSSVARPLHNTLQRSNSPSVSHPSAATQTVTQKEIACPSADAASPGEHAETMPPAEVQHQSQAAAKLNTDQGAVPSSLPEAAPADAVSRPPVTLPAPRGVPPHAQMWSGSQTPAGQGQLGGFVHSGNLGVAAKLLQQPQMPTAQVAHAAEPAEMPLPPQPAEKDHSAQSDSQRTIAPLASATQNAEFGADRICAQAKSAAATAARCASEGSAPSAGQVNSAEAAVLQKASEFCKTPLYVKLTDVPLGSDLPVHEPSSNRPPPLLQLTPLSTTATVLRGTSVAKSGAAPPAKPDASPGRAWAALPAQKPAAAPLSPARKKRPAEGARTLERPLKRTVIRTGCRLPPEPLLSKTTMLPSVLHHV